MVGIFQYIARHSCIPYTKLFCYIQSVVDIWDLISGIGQARCSIGSI